jgi:excisionase family DNA binding protein
VLTVPEAARRLNRDPETIRRWIRSGRLAARKVGTQHVIDEHEIDRIAEPEALRLPKVWRRTRWGDPMPDVVAWVRSSRSGR